MKLQRIRLVVALLALAPACTSKPSTPATPATTTAAQPEPAKPGADPQADMMAVGLDALYKRGDNQAAIAQFRRLLDVNPNHYGAHYQLAVALERSGDPAAKDEWKKVLAAATSINDAPTIKDAKAHLGI